LSYLAVSVSVVSAVQTYRYLGPSTAGAAGVALQTSGGPAANPRFFTGFLTTPQPAAAALLAVAEVARTRYFQPRDPASLDPVVWAGPAGRSLRLPSRPAPGAVCLAGAGRLAALRGLLRHARTLRVYGPAVTAASAPVASTWELDTGALRLSLTLSPEPYRGF